MTLVPTRRLFDDAYNNGNGICAFNVVHLETAEGLVRASEETQTPIILQVSENCVKYHGSLGPIAAATMALAAQSSSEIAIHLDHAEDSNLAKEAIDLGFGSVMYDGAKLNYADNVQATQQIVEYAHEAGVLVEAELGEIGGKNGAHTPGVKTDPAEAQKFASETGVDALAIAVGSSHAMTDRTSVLDLARIRETRALVSVPLVLYGSSGVPDEAILEGIRAGLTKINISTLLNSKFTSAVRQKLADDPNLVDSRKYVSAGRDALRVTAASLIRSLSTGS